MIKLSKTGKIRKRCERCSDWYWVLPGKRRDSVGEYCQRCEEKGTREEFIIKGES